MKVCMVLYRRRKWPFIDKESVLLTSLFGWASKSTSRPVLLEEGSGPQRVDFTGFDPPLQIFNGDVTRFRIEVEA